MFVVVFDWYEEEHQKRQYANGHSRGQRFNPQHQVVRHCFRFGVFVPFAVAVAVAVVVIMVMVTVARTQFWQREKNEREQQRPGEVFENLFGQHRRHREICTSPEVFYRWFPADRGVGGEAAAASIVRLSVITCEQE